MIQGGSVHAWLLSIGEDELHWAISEKRLESKADDVLDSALVPLRRRRHLPRVPVHPLQGRVEPGNSLLDLEHEGVLVQRGSPHDHPPRSLRARGPDLGKLGQHVLRPQTDRPDSSKATWPEHF